ncbi:MAG: Crp/Fnr family transcriptional regulator [Deltaproteobacteria bacterium]|nr:Crp/Fnr family transcriptional regulator [Deltaproteobacteria bacterium]
MSIDQLRANPVFAQASEPSLAKLANAARAVSYGVDQHIVACGEPADRVFVLVAGTVRVFHRAHNGDEVVVKVLGAPAIFGEAEALPGGLPYQENVAAVGVAARVLIIPRQAMVALLRQEPQVAYRLLLDVSHRLAIASYNERSLAFHPPTVRLANYLLDYPCPSECRVVALTQQQMAEAIGVSRRSVNKDITAWKREGIVERHSGGYRILDAARLSNYADSERLSLTYRLSRD